MIIEHVHLQIKPEQSQAFEQAFQKATAFISVSNGFNEVQLLKNIQDEHRYILMVVWNALEDHTEGFRKSAEYQQWKALLHPFYVPMPTVEYYQPCISLKK